MTDELLDKIARLASGHPGSTPTPTPGARCETCEDRGVYDDADGNVFECPCKLEPRPTKPEPVGNTRPATHRNDPQTSRAAARSIAHITGDGQQAALDAIAAAWPDGLTDDELAARTGMDRYTIAPRRGEIARKGWVRNSGRRRSNQKGNPATVWILTDDAVRALRLSFPPEHHQEALPDAS